MRFGHIAGDPLLDLLNTVAWRLGGDERAERLRTFGDVIDWCAESGLLSADEAGSLRELAERNGAGTPAEDERKKVIKARESAYATLFEDAPGAAAELAAMYRAAVAGADLVRTDDHPRWDWQDREIDLSTPRHRIVRGLLALTQRDDLDRLHQCEDVKCGWVYLDTSPRRNRRWCNTKDCGDRNRARAYYARQKAKV